MFKMFSYISCVAICECLNWDSGSKQTILQREGKNVKNYYKEQLYCDNNSLLLYQVFFKFFYLLDNIYVQFFLSLMSLALLSVIWSYLQ